MGKDLIVGHFFPRSLLKNEVYLLPMTGLGSTSLIEKRQAILAAFQCQQSGNCCKAAGVVYLDITEQQQMARVLGLSLMEFLQQYTKREQGWCVLADHRFRPTCMLNAKNGCSVYEARPKACRTYPDWDNIWESDEHLYAEMKVCPGLKKAVQHFID